MTRDEFLNRLGELLACLPADQVKETQEFYAEAIADRMEDGMTEAEAVAAMGTPGEVAEATLDELPAVPRAIARTKRKSTALLWALAIVGSPVWIPLLLAFVAVAATVYICIGFLRSACGSWPRHSGARAWWGSCSPWTASLSGMFRTF